MIDSRSKTHPDWVQAAINSVKAQTVKCELIVISNVDRKKTIGQCWNEGVKHCNGDWILFLGDDDRITSDYVYTLEHNIKRHANKNMVAIATFMTVFDNQKDESYRQAPTGAIKREYLLQHPFNEKLEKGVDRDWFDNMKMRGDLQVVIPYHFGYYYRQHDDYSCAAPVHIITEPKDIYMVAVSPQFIDPIAKKLINEGHSVHVDTNGFDPRYAEKAKVIWSDWGNVDAKKVAEFECDAKKILRIHAWEVFFQIIHHINLDAFDHVVFVAKHIKEYLEKRHKRTYENAVVIPNGVKMDEWFIAKRKPKNNKIAMAGNIAEGKGTQLLLFMAKEFPEYDFHVCGRFAQEDVAEYFMEKKPDNVILDSWQYDLNDWFKDKTYIISPSIRESQHMAVMEGMACGLKPLVFDWIGAKDIYKPEWVWNSMNEFDKLLKDGCEPLKYRRFIEENYNFEDKYKQIKELIV